MPQGLAVTGVSRLVSADDEDVAVIGLNDIACMDNSDEPRATVDLNAGWVGRRHVAHTFAD